MSTIQLTGPADYYYQQSRYCSLHGQFFTSYCPLCYPQQSTVTVSPGTTEEAIASMVRAFDSIINNLREQLADRDRQIQELLTEKPDI